MKYKVAIHVIAIILLCTIQSTLLQYVKIFGVKPNLVLIYVVCVALLRGYTEGAIIGAFSGLFLDVLGGRSLGLYTLVGMYLGLAVGSINKRIFRENILIVIFFTLIFSIAYEFSVFLLGSFLPSVFDRTVDPLNILYALKQIILPEAIYNSIISIFIFILVMRSNNRYMELSKSSRKY